MGLSICIYDNDLSHEIWQSCYSTYHRFIEDTYKANLNIRWPEKFRYNDEICWSYEEGIKLAQDLKLALLDKKFNDKWGLKTEVFIKGLEKACELKLNLILC